MKQYFLAICLFSALLGFKAKASSSYLDGCFQLYQPGAMYPAFCLQGMAEEGIGGAGARLVIFHVNSSQVAACLKSSGINGSRNSMEFVVGSKKEMILSNIKYIGSSNIEGDATFGKTTLKFIKINPSSTARLLSVFQAQRECQNLDIGQSVVIKR